MRRIADLLGPAGEEALYDLANDLFEAGIRYADWEQK